MSEYQYYEFQAVDRPLTDKEVADLRSYSTRARITPTSFVNDYSWGNFKGNEDAWMEKYFDAFLSSLVSVRAELGRGDLRALYLGWLSCAQGGDLDDDDVEPPVPAGLAQLSAALGGAGMVPVVITYIKLRISSLGAGDGGQPTIRFLHKVPLYVILCTNRARDGLREKVP